MSQELLQEIANLKQDIARLNAQNWRPDEESVALHKVAKLENHVKQSNIELKSSVDSLRQELSDIKQALMAYTNQKSESAMRASLEAAADVIVAERNNIKGEIKSTLSKVHDDVIAAKAAASQSAHSSAEYLLGRATYLARG